nr:Rid family hydrolase [Psychrobacter sp. P11G5]
MFYGRSSRYPFSSAVRLGDTLYLSGQIGLKDGKLVEGGIKAETKQALDNVNALLVKYGYQKTDLVNCTAMLADLSKFGEFNEAYAAGLSEPYPEGTLLGTDEPLILGASVELECSARK